MRIDFNEIEEFILPGMNGGVGTMSARMYIAPGWKIIPCTIHAGGSIGMHGHPTSDEMDYVLSGTGTAVCDGVREQLGPGVCHVCRKGSEHSLVNTGSEPLVLLTVVVERERT